MACLYSWTSHTIPRRWAGIPTVRMKSLAGSRAWGLAVTPRLTQPGNEPLPPGNHTATSALAASPLGLPLGLACTLPEAWGTEGRYPGGVGTKGEGTSWAGAQGWPLEAR